MAIGKYALVDEKILLEERKLQRTEKLSPTEENACDEKVESNNDENTMMFTSLDTTLETDTEAMLETSVHLNEFQGTESRRNVKTIGSFLCNSLSSLI